MPSRAICPALNRACRRRLRPSRDGYARLRPVDVGILGGTGPAGSGLAARLATAGLEVVIGSRSKDRAEQTCEEIRKRWPEREFHLEAGDNLRAASADMV